MEETNGIPYGENHYEVEQIYWFHFPFRFGLHCFAARSRALWQEVE